MEAFGIQPLLLAAQIVNFLILAYILKRFLYKPVLEVLKKREKKIKDGLQAAEEGQAFLDKANLRFSKGETNILEKTTAEAQRGQIAIQLNQLKNDVEILLLRFQLLLNSGTSFIPSVEKPQLVFQQLADTNIIADNPQIKQLQQQKQISLLNTKLERAKMLPNLIAGYSNTSIQGTGSDNVFYDSNKRFSSVQFGIGLPLFFGPQKARINASKTQSLIAENNYRLRMQSLSVEYNSALKQYQVQKATVEYYESTALQNAQTITKAANQNFSNGEIDYLQFTILLNQAIAIQSDYLDAVKNLNEAIIELNYLTGR